MNTLMQVVATILAGLDFREIAKDAEAKLREPGANRKDLDEVAAAYAYAAASMAATAAITSISGVADELAGHLGRAYIGAADALETLSIDTDESRLNALDKLLALRNDLHSVAEPKWLAVSEVLVKAASEATGIGINTLTQPDPSLARITAELQEIAWAEAQNGVTHPLMAYIHLPKPLTLRQLARTVDRGTFTLPGTATPPTVEQTEQYLYWARAEVASLRLRIADARRTFGMPSEDAINQVVEGVPDGKKA